MQVARTTTQDKAVRIRKAAEILDVSTTTVHRHFVAGHLKGCRTSHGKTAPIMIYVSSVVQFAKKEQGRDVTL
jgi:predicted site-specific integrase-resolvase